MTFLILTIACSTFNHLLFKTFSRYRIDLLSAIVVNYGVCILIGYGSSFQSVSPGTVLSQSWYPFSILQGILFVGCLYFLGRTTAKNGVTAASIATRLSVAMPTAAAFFLYADLVTTSKIAGILAAIVALYLSCAAPNRLTGPAGTLSKLPVVLFLFFGTHSTLIKFVQERFLENASDHTYVMSAFFSAFLISAVFLVWRLVKKLQTFGWKDLVAGFALGCGNYGAIYFLIRALSVPGSQSSRLFPTISISVVILSALGAWGVFNERPARRVIFALLIGVAAIVLVNV
ncbi:MAG: hypothetical protein GY765_34295 [bacterium]|nr:hypothetical protein [bacterium]